MGFLIIPPDIYISFLCFYYPRQDLSAWVICFSPRKYLSTLTFCCWFKTLKLIIPGQRCMSLFVLRLFMSMCACVHACLCMCLCVCVCVCMCTCAHVCFHFIVEKETCPLVIFIIHDSVILFLVRIFHLLESYFLFPLLLSSSSLSLSFFFYSCSSTSLFSFDIKKTQMV